MARRNIIHVNLTITTLDESLARAVEPLAPRPALRLAALRALADAKIRVTVLAHPVMPLINDSEDSLDAVCAAAAANGAASFSAAPLFLKPCAQRVFFPFLEQRFPHLVSRYRERFEANAYLRGHYPEMIQQRVRDMVQRIDWDLGTRIMSRRTGRTPASINSSSAVLQTAKIDPSLMWQQTYTPIGGSLGLSALVAAIPIFVLLFVLAALRLPAWKASLIGLVAAIGVALGAYHMPAGPLIGSVLYGAAFGLFPIGWIVYSAIVLYRVTVETGKFEIIKDSVGGLTDDKRLQALLIAFAFGAFIEGASGFGTPVAVAAAMMTGLGFSPFYAAAICLLANTAPVAFGSIGIPVITLAGVTGLPLRELSANVGRICAPVSLFIPGYLML